VWEEDGNGVREGEVALDDTKSRERWWKRREGVGVKRFRLNSPLQTVISDRIVIQNYDERGEKE
jgi:hypothetical protein